MKSSCLGALNWRPRDGHLIDATIFLQLLYGRKLPGERWVPGEKGEKAEALGRSSKTPGSQRDLGDVLQHRQTAGREEQRSVPSRQDAIA